MKRTTAVDLIGRIGKPTNVRAGGAMTSANRRRDHRRNRKAVRMALRQQSWDD